jgi:hypothetical protein
MKNFLKLYNVGFKMKINKKKKNFLKFYKSSVVLKKFLELKMFKLGEGVQGQGWKGEEKIFSTNRIINKIKRISRNIEKNFRNRNRTRNTKLAHIL